jgi:hypothetical protein
MKLYVKPGRRYRLEGKEYGAGDAVDVPEKFVRLLTHTKGPLEVRTTPGGSATDLPRPPAGDNLSALRQEYEAAVGRRPYHGWDAAELRSRMNTYRTTHLTAG